MPKLKVYQIDTFTAEPFSGNPTVVFPNAVGLTDEQMRAVASEMGCSAAVFVRLAREARADFQMRFFAPEAELSLSGHGIMAAFYALVHEGRILLNAPVVTQKVNTRAGTLSAELFVHKNELHHVAVSQIPPTFKEPDTSLDEVTAVLGLEAKAIRTDLPFEIVSTGIPQLIIPVRSLEALSNPHPDFSRLADLNRQLSVTSTCVFTLETKHVGAAATIRHFAPLTGTLEDAGTGSAAGNLGCYLVRHGIRLPGEMAMEQGIEMGRPSSLYVDIQGIREQIKSVKVGGRAVVVMAGELQF